MLRRLRSLRLATAVPMVAVPLALLTLAGCSTASSSSVMNVDGREVTVKEFKQELAYYAGNKKFVEAVGGAANIGTVGEYNSGFVANLLTNDLYSIIIEQEAVANKVKAAPATAEMRAQVASQMGGEEALKGFPSAYQEKLLERNLLVAGLTEHFSKANDPKKYFEANQAEFESTCISHILVATEDVAKAARARIVAGEDFAKVAKELSTDPGSKDTGGVLPCGSVAQYVAPFAAAASKLKVAELSQPVATEFGFHLIKVTKRETPKYDDATKAEVTTKVQALADQQLTAALQKRLTTAKITVNANYGKLNTEGQGGLPVIDPKDVKPNAQLVKPAGKASASTSAPAPTAAP